MTTALSSRILTPEGLSLINNHSSPAFSIPMEQQATPETKSLKLEALKLLIQDLHHREILHAQQKKNSDEVFLSFILKHPEVANKNIEEKATPSASNTFFQEWTTEKIALNEKAKNIAHDRIALLSELSAIAGRREDIRTE